MKTKNIADKEETEEKKREELPPELIEAKPEKIQVEEPVLEGEEGREDEDKASSDERCTSEESEEHRTVVQEDMSAQDGSSSEQNKESQPTSPSSIEDGKADSHSVSPVSPKEDVSCSLELFCSCYPHV